MTSQSRSPETTSPTRAAARGVRFAGRRRRRATPTAPAVPPVERANGWLVALAVVGGAVLFSVLAMNAFLGG
ncbi:hypothetical protein [Cellulosimicrobium marinum]|uniref:hypothetical protein n=1 Tax=Cellulosimicrobium marinum TaxID=1638992 RepID=UPI001E382A73|nr:hypothetical protein [Cellulosimicrobium marinum]MCB7136218.1 hypothetical protein [Cellulosimicrobium marinum]